MTRACHGPVRAAVGSAFSDEEIDDVLERLAERYRAKRAADPSADHERMWRAAAAETTREDMVADLITRRLRAKAAIARKRRTARLGAMGFDDEARALRAFNVGEEGAGFGRGLSVDAQGRALFAEWAGQVVAQLAEAGLLARMSNPFGRRDVAFERAVADEMHRLRGGKAAAATGDADALAVARILVDAQERAREAQNDAGAWIHALPGYVARQSHDAIKVSGGFWRGGKRAGQEARFEAWRAFIEPRLDEVTFEGVADRRAYLRRIWSDIVAGVHDTVAGAGDDLDGFRPPAAKARSVSAARTLHFKSPKDWMEYNDQFGRGSLLEAITGSLDRAARNTALMRNWGPAPRAAFEHHLRAAADQALSRGDAATAAQIKRTVVQAEFDQLDGTAEAPESPRLAAVSRALRMQQALSKLGGMTVSALTDTGLASDTVKRAGASYLDGYAYVTQALMGLDGAARQEAAELLHVGVRAIIGDISSRYAATDSAVGAMGKMQSMFYRLNLFSFWAARVRRGVGAALSRHLGIQSAKGWAALDETTRGQLERYGLGEAEWELVRGHAAAMDGDVQAGLFLTPEAAEAVPDINLRAWAGAAADLGEARRDLRLRLQAYFLDQVDTAMTEPRARERAALRFGTRAGTVAGVAVELITQFKQFPVTVLTRHVKPALGGFAGLSPLATTAHLILATTALGFVAMQAKQFLKGRTPRPLDRGETWLAALIQGGGLGIFADFLFADYNRFGRSALATLGGPAVGEVEGLLQVLGALRDGEDASAKALRLAIGNVPFVNLFYTRAALDYLVLYSLYESVSPGYLERYERTIEERTGSTFILSPNAAAR